MDAPHRRDFTPEDLFWAKVNKTDSCWEWTAAKSVDGYANFWYRNAWLRAHRVSYEWAHGPIPAGMQVDHMCRNPGCVNPVHMRLATNALNSQNRSGAYSNGTSGARGVSWRKASQKWSAYATLNRKRTYIGEFRDIEDAKAAVSEWRRIHMPYSLMDQKKAE
jgi:HNH endonuclease